jgi:hypothetical protein
MSQLDVTSLNVATLLEKLKKREWLIPHFQRDFIWSVNNVIDLVESIFAARPIGMATLWEQGDDSELALHAISIMDRDAATKLPVPRYFEDTDKNPKRVYAVLDGRQRCTAIAMAFGGFRTLDARQRYSGRYFLNVAETDQTKQILFVRESQLATRGLATDAQAIGQGHFPLSSSIPGESLFAQWLRYTQALRDGAFYPDQRLPPPDELERRDAILKAAFQGINDTKLAVYIVPQDYSLAEICEIFETLNQTGVKVSTVDLIHSWLYSDTVSQADGPVLLRDWIAELGQLEGAVGWASASDRPELIAQMVTACHVALEEKPDPRRIGRKSSTKIGSVKASDLLATPTEHWKNVIGNTDRFAEFIGDFQKVVARGYFPASSCPYPVSAAIYVALRWHQRFDAADTHPWQINDLDALFRAFFWRNALSTRYDQGFLTQLGTDLRTLKEWLDLRPKFASSSQWAAHVTKLLDKFMEAKPVPSAERLCSLLTDGKPGGALQQAMVLPMIAGVRKDFVEPQHTLAYPDAEAVELHHIYPKAWCRNNRNGALEGILDPDKSDRNWVESIANLMPLSRSTNNIWKAKIPGQLLREKHISFTSVQDLLKPVYIDKECFDHLFSAPQGIKEFWEHRARLIADDLSIRTKIVL